MENTIATSNGASDEIIVAKVKKTTTIPNSDIALIDLAKNVYQYWLNHSDYTLIWANPTTLTDTLTNLEIAFNQKQNDKSTRTPVAKQIATLNAEINKSIEHVKAYITEKYDK